MKTIAIDFSNMWGAVETFTVDYFLRCFPYLRPHYRFVLERERPDVVFYSVYGYVQKEGRHATRIVYSGEAGDPFGYGGRMGPDTFEAGFYHYGLTMAIENTHPNHLYMPLCCPHLPLHNNGITDLIRQPGAAPPQKEFFCDFIYSNGYSRRRVDFFHRLSQYKRVESLGAVERNNDALAGTGYDTAGYRVKQAFQSRCKFSIAFENAVFPGYTSEKLSDPLLARSVPIYWGNPRVNDIFNPHAFINVDDFASDEDAIAYIRDVDQDDDRYRAYLDEPPFRDNVVPERYSDATYLAFFQRIFG
ncbi:MAG TPA: glycosyltransferase family 10 [Vicinamibacterales bacterium]|nr:glycosyltransferase family 10 [Vicinamibacterales bacterium]